MNNDVFKFKYMDKEKFIAEVCANDELTVAMNPFVSSDYKFITIFRTPRDYTITIIKEGGKTFSFEKGMLVSDNLRILRRKVFEFAREYGFRV